MEKGYDNSAFGTDIQTTSMELERVVTTGKAKDKCCGNSNIQNNSSNNNFSKTTGPNTMSDVCRPKCPAVRPSPWDPIKTKFAAVLTIGIVIWFFFGVFVVKF